MPVAQFFFSTETASKPHSRPEIFPLPLLRDRLLRPLFSSPIDPISFFLIALLHPICRIMVPKYSTRSSHPESLKNYLFYPPFPSLNLERIWCALKACEASALLFEPPLIFFFSFLHAHHLISYPLNVFHKPLASPTSDPFPLPLVKGGLISNLQDGVLFSRDLLPSKASSVPNFLSSP